MAYNPVNILDVIDEMVLDVREFLSKEESFTHTMYQYSGMCGKACVKFGELMRDYNTQNNINISVKLLHGEQKHTPMIDKSKWSKEHSWAIVEDIDGNKIYVDPTSEQFKGLYRTIPNYYISSKKPPWYYCDVNNPARNWFTGWLDDRIKIPHRICVNQVIMYGIVMYFQYIVWGSLSNLIRRLLFRHRF